jgi:hypothetical protein
MTKIINPAPIVRLVSPLTKNDPFSLALSGSVSSRWLGSDNLIQSFNDLSQFLWRRAADHFSYPFDRERSNLADFHPGFFRKPSRMKFERQRKACALRLTRESDGNYCSGPFVENILAQNQNWTLSCLFSPAYWI